VPAEWIEPAATIGARRDEIVVCIPVFGAHEQFVGCLRSVLAHTPADVRILIADDASPDFRSEEFVRELAKSDSLPHRLLYLRRPENVGFPANLNGVFAAAAPADVVILNSDCVVGDGWIEGLRSAAHCDSNVATATALTNHGSILSVPDRGTPRSQLPQEWSFDQAAAAVRARSPRLRPRLPTAIGHCMYVRRSALDLVGDFDLAFSPGYGEEVDFSQRCLRIGLNHVAADEVLVLHHGGGSFSSNGAESPAKQRHEHEIATRYPYYHDVVRAFERDESGPLARSLHAARRAINGLSLTIDARILGGTMSGTQLHVMELIAALARRSDVRVTALVPPDLGSYTAGVLTQLDNVEIQTVTGRRRRPGVSERADVVHRPFQVSSTDDLSFLAALGDRLVVTHQDLISYRNPSYFQSPDAWAEFRRLTRRALAISDRVLFFSAHARDDALAENLVEPHRTSVVHIGVDHSLARIEHAPQPPRGAERLPDDAELILCLGTDFRHKNRVFAMRLVVELQRHHDWDGWLVLAGPRVQIGSSRPEEDQLLALNPRLAARVLDVASVTEAEKAWLLGRSRLVAYPTVYEGFGLVPFEAVARGVPCLWSQGTSLSEILPDAAAGIVPWDPVSSAARALRLMHDDDARSDNLDAVREAASRLTWDATAERLVEVYNQACDEPASQVGTLERTEGLMSPEVSEDALRLIGPGGALPRDLERPLLALASHPTIGTPVFKALRAGYRAYRRGKSDSDNGR
jgi:glycosyltransferase involved in cell wall biosynthesis